MNFEELTRRLVENGAATPDEAAGMLRTLVAVSARAPVQIALALVEHKRFFDGPRWAINAAAEFGLPDDKFAHHRYAVGAMLRAIQRGAADKFDLFYTMPISHLEIWGLLYNDASRRVPETPLVSIINFLRSNPDAPAWKREKLLDAVRVFIDPERSASHTQMELDFTFDALNSELKDDAIERVTRSEAFNGGRAFIMTFNGAKLCRHGIAAIAADADGLDTAALLVIDRELERARQLLRPVIARKHTGE